MSGLSLYGFSSVFVMLLSYAFESRDTAWTFLFAIACLNASIYAVLAGSIPFAIVEGIWTGVAFKRWIDAKRGRTFFLHTMSAKELVERAEEMKGHPAHGLTKRFLDTF